MSFSRLRLKKRLLCPLIGFILALLPINCSRAELGWKDLNAAMETKTQLFADHGWKPTTAPSTALYVGLFEFAFPQGYWRLSKDRNVSSPSIHQPIRTFVKKGTPVTFVFYSNPDFQKNAQLRFSLKKAKAPYTTLWTQVSKLNLTDSNWSKHYIKISFLSPEIKPDEVMFDVALEPPTNRAEFGSTWFYIAGRNDPLNEKALVNGADKAHRDATKLLDADSSERRIERLHKGKLVITVQDQNGRPMPGATIKLRQTRNAFAFGCALKVSQIADPQFQQSKSTKAMFSLFNTALLEMDWSEIEKSKGIFDFTALDQSIAFLKRNNMTVIVAPWTPGQKPPAWLESSKATAGAAIRSYVSNSVSHLSKNVEGFQFRLDQGNVIGEWVNHNTPKLAAEKLLAWAHVAGAEKNATLILRADDAEKMKHVFALLARDGTVPNGLSIGMPIAASSWHNVDDWIILESLKPLGTDLYVMGWIESAKPGQISEQEIASVIPLYTAMFSHPSVKAIIFPNPIESATLASTNGTTTPLYKLLLTNMRTEWCSNRDGETDKTGKITSKAFFGQYEIIADDKKGHTAKTEVNFSASQPTPKEVILTINN